VRPLSILIMIVIQLTKKMVQTRKSLHTRKVDILISISIDIVCNRGWRSRWYPHTSPWGTFWFEVLMIPTEMNINFMWQWPCNTSSENSSKSKTNTRTGKTVFKLPTNIHFLVKFRISKTSYFINNKQIFLKLRIFTNFNTDFPVVVFVFDFKEFSEECYMAIIKTQFKLKYYSRKTRRFHLICKCFV
jgi:hypothetical protein